MKVVQTMTQWRLRRVDRQVDWEASNVNQRREYENEVMEYRRRVVRRLSQRADRAEIHNDHEEAEALRKRADDLECL